jgi:hypothetical protein
MAPLSAHIPLARRPPPTTQAHVQVYVWYIRCARIREGGVVGEVHACSCELCSMLRAQMGASMQMQTAPHAARARARIAGRRHTTARAKLPSAPTPLLSAAFPARAATARACHCMLGPEFLAGRKFQLVLLCDASPCATRPPRAGARGEGRRGQVAPASRPRDHAPASAIARVPHVRRSRISPVWPPFPQPCSP